MKKLQQLGGMMIRNRALPFSTKKAIYGNKADLRKYIKQNKKLISQLGEICDLKEIGEGGNGLVFGGTLFDSPIAIKFLVDTKSREKLKRFKAEYLNVALLPPNAYVVKTLAYEEFNIDGKVYPAIMMKKYNGSLRRKPNAPPFIWRVRKIV